MKVRKSFAETYSKDSNGGATDIIEVVPPVSAEKRVIQQVIATDLDNTLTSIEIAAGRVGVEVEIDYVANPQAGERVIPDINEIHINPGERLIVTFTGATNRDDLRVHCRGWIEVNDGN